MKNSSPIFIYVLVLASGMAALSWEVIWQIKSSLALGVSSWGAAITLAVAMGGMSAGALLMGRILKNREVCKPIRIYGILEWIIGLSGLCLIFAFNIVESLDSWVYSVAPHWSALMYIGGIITILGLPTMCMGATLPVLGLVARQHKISIALLYGFNTLGAAVGVLLAAFLFIPALGIQNTVYVMAFINIVVGVVTWLLKTPEDLALKTSEQSKQTNTTQYGLSMPMASMLVFVTGFVTFMLEIAWFRSLTATFLSTTDAFAIMLACVLLALGIGAWIIPTLKKHMILPLGSILVGAGILILLATPIIERLDMIVPVRGLPLVVLFASWFQIAFCFIGLPILLLGMVLPSILDDQTSPRKWAFLYALNAFAAIFGAILAAWVFLPTVGFAKTAWIAGVIVIVAGMIQAEPRRRMMLGGLSIIALVIAVTFESGVGRTRIQGLAHVPDIMARVPVTKILQSYEGPDVTASAVEYEDGGRALFIDGFVATQQPATGYMVNHIHYMASMGHMPMLMHPDPKQALVICFGTGQTANAVRNENPETLDIVDVNKNIFKLAPYFPSNENVLDDPRVNAIVSDGRAYLRRTDKIYDIITMEPMPPSFAGVNALYSKEFYEIAREKLGQNGVIAQWLPFHHTSTYYNASIARTFQSVFSNAILWIDPPSNIGILLGTVNEEADLGQYWPGLDRQGVKRKLTNSQVTDAPMLSPEELLEFGNYGEVITDDNQLLSYGAATYAIRKTDNTHAKTHALIESIKNK